MKKLFLTLLVGATTTACMQAKVISPEQALSRLADNPASCPARMLKAQARPNLVATRSIDGQPAVYVYGMADGHGYLVLSADDQAMPLLGYQEKGAFSADAINPTMQWWLDQYAQEIKWLRDNPDAATRRLPAPETEKKPIAPLLKTKWNQDAPYNNFCPVTSDGQRCVTGCVATTMAQIANYHRLPAGNGTGNASTTFEDKEYTFDFGKETFDWDNMLDEYGYDGDYTEAQADAVAKLMYACGVSLDMRYSPIVSYAYSERMPTELVEHFGFDKSASTVFRSWYGLQDWIDYVYSQLKEYGPVPYGGVGDVGGHSFVCDGYDGDGFFHFNWGWGGVSDGYFKLTALDPLTQGIGGGSAGFNVGQDILVNIGPPREGSEIAYTMIIDGTLGMADTSGNPIHEAKLGEETGLSGGFYNYSIQEVVMSFGWSIEPADGGENIYVTSHGPEAVPVWAGYDFLTVTLPENLADGEYRVRPVWKLDGTDNWREFRMPVTSAAFVDMTVKEGTASFTWEEAPMMEAEITSWTSPRMVGKPMGMNVRIKNPTDREYVGFVFTALLSPDMELLGYGSEIGMDLLAGESSEFYYNSVISPATDTPILPGNYLYAFADEQGRVISELYEIVLESAPEEQGTLECDSFEFVGDPEAADNMDLNFKARITCVKGYFVGDVNAWIFSLGADEPLRSITSGTQFIKEGESVDVTFSGAAPELLPGGKYESQLYDGTGWITDGEGSCPTLTFTVRDNSGIDSVESAEAVSREVYTPSGLRVSETGLAPGIYIVRERHADGTLRTAKVLIR